MDIYLGIDGGGTSTRAILVNRAGEILGLGQAGPSNYNDTGLVVAQANLVTATAAAWADYGETMRPADSAFVGCAGLKSSIDFSRLRAVAEDTGLVRTGDVVAVNDLHNALSGGLGGEPGIALIAGTGSNCLGRDANGETFMCGGWGWLIDGPGSGFGLGIAGMQAAVRAADGRGEPTRLLESILAFWGLSEINELNVRLYVEAWTIDEVARLAPLIIRLADEGDVVAHDILKRGANELSQLVVGAAQALNFPDGPDVVILGGCASSGAPYQPLIEAAILSALPQARIQTPQYTTTEGAAINALMAAGITNLPQLTYHNK
jgi:N-acetylglucosamine kinase